MKDHLTDLLHLLLCQDIHEHDMVNIKSRVSGICYFYLEDQIASDTPLPDSQKWLEIKESFKGSMGFTTDQEAFEFVKGVINISKDIRTLVKDNNKRLEFVMQILS